MYQQAPSPKEILDIIDQTIGAVMRENAILKNRIDTFKHVSSSMCQRIAQMQEQIDRLNILFYRPNQD